MKRRESLLRLAVSQPTEVLSFTLPEWDQLIRQARTMGLLGAIEGKLNQAGLIGKVPTEAIAHLEGARNLALSYERVIRWEVHCIQKAIEEVGTEIILLKGAAYIFC